jgi:hypothetical protein
MMHGLTAGVYLVNKQDGSVTEFFVTVTEKGLIHSTAGSKHLAACSSSPVWMWRKMEVPDAMPDQLPKRTLRRC